MTLEDWIEAKRLEAEMSATNGLELPDLIEGYEARMALEEALAFGGVPKETHND